MKYHGAPRERAYLEGHRGGPVVTRLGGAGIGGSGLELGLWRVKINQGHSERSRKRRGSGRQTVHQGKPTSVQEELLEQEAPQNGGRRPNNSVQGEEAFSIRSFTHSIIHSADVAFGLSTPSGIGD